MPDAHRLTLFMLVTNRDCMIADYAVRSYRKLRDIFPSFRVQVYANALSDENKRRHFPRWRQSYTEIIDNHNTPGLSDRKGKPFTTPEGVALQFDDNCEHYDEVWTREHQRAGTEYWGTVDADFEMLSPHFMVEIIRKLDGNPRLAGVSSNYTPTRRNHFDSYSGEHITLHERWGTWCCVYRRETGRHLREVSSYYYQEVHPDGTRYAFDSYAYFQQHLTTKCGFVMESLGDEYQPQFIHYKAFSKNRSITERNIWLYRQLAIRGKNGPGGRIARAVMNRLFGDAMKERHSYDFEVQKTK